MGDLGVDCEYPMLMSSHWLLLDAKNNQPIYACYTFKCLLMNEVLKKMYRHKFKKSKSQRDYYIIQDYLVLLMVLKLVEFSPT